MPKHGKSLRQSLQDCGAMHSGHGIVYYNGEDGKRAVYDVTDRDTGLIIINGVAPDIDGFPAIAPSLPVAEHYFQTHDIAISSGWNVCP